MTWLSNRNQPGEPDNMHPGSDVNSVDPETAARRRSRLQRRISNLEHDIERAGTAGHPTSHWRRRIDEINAAITQAENDANQLESDASVSAAIQLDATPISAIEVNLDIPATVTFTIGTESFRYSEEVDWTERGEQRALPGLRRFAGTPEALIPDGTPQDRREALAEHLRHAVGALAIGLRDGSGLVSDELTLADLASPCAICGNWRDHRDRCITCQRREWQASDIRAEVSRMVEERNSLSEEIAKQREALPILQRQLQDARRELEKYASN